MARMSKFLIILLLGFGLTGCATYYKIKVNGYTAPQTAEQLKPGGFFYVMEDKEAKNPLLEAEVKRKIARLLEERGYPVTTSFDNAEYRLGFWLGARLGLGLWRPGGGHRGAGVRLGHPLRSLAANQGGGGPALPDQEGLPRRLGGRSQKLRLLLGLADHT